MCRGRCDDSGKGVGVFVVDSVQVFEEGSGEWDAWRISKGIEGRAIEGVVVRGGGIPEERGEMWFTGCMVPGEVKTADRITG